MAFEKIDAHVARSSQPVREVVLVTDLRNAGWDAGVTDVVDRWAAGNVSLRIIDVGSGVTGNVVLKSLEQTAPIALIHTPVSFLARIHNDGSEPAVAQEATLTVDGKPQVASCSRICAAKAGVDLPVTVTFDSRRNARDRAARYPATACRKTTSATSRSTSAIRWRSRSSMANPIPGPSRARPISSNWPIPSVERPGKLRG